MVFAGRDDIDTLQISRTTYDKNGISEFRIPGNYMRIETRVYSDLPIRRFIDIGGVERERENESPKKNKKMKFFLHELE